jgi:uncharacterized protein YbaP (TraB family)
MKLILAAACAALALVSTASAQEPAPPSPATLVEEVEVIARLPGPALWRVSTPTSQIWFFAGPGIGLPKGFQWDDRRVAKALEGARELVTPPVATAGFGAIFTVLIDPGHILHEPPGHTVRGDLPPDLLTRWEQAARAVGQDPAHYDHWRPLLAAAAMQGDIAKRDKWNQTGIGVQLNPLVRKLHVKMRPLASYSAMDLLKSLANTPETGTRACLGYMADVALAPPGGSMQAVEAWAKGDFAPALALNSRASVCIDATPALVELRNRVAADWAKDLKAELAKPGKVVVTTDLDNLTRKGGLLDQMKAEGLDVIGPAWE